MCGLFIKTRPSRNNFASHPCDVVKLMERVVLESLVKPKKDKVESYPWPVTFLVAFGVVSVAPRTKWCVKPASDYKLIRRFRLSRRCRSSCRDFRLY